MGATAPDCNLKLIRPGWPRTHSTISAPHENMVCCFVSCRDSNAENHARWIAHATQYLTADAPMFDSRRG